jgi:ABC-2 type transport system ATP-binding protein
MVYVHKLTKRYGSLVAVENLSFQLEKGEVLGFLGPNGAGKTTTMRIITGYMPPTKGTVHIEGLDIIDYPLQAKKLIGYLPENPPLYNDMSVSEYLNFVADVKQVSANEKRSSIFNVMEQCGLTDVRKRIIGHLSKGYRQRVGIAQALVNNPSVLILDEPTIGLDPKQIIEIRELIKNLSGDRTVILSTHILPEVTMICSKVVIINQGKIVLEESLESISPGQQARRRRGRKDYGYPRRQGRAERGSRGVRYRTQARKRNKGRAFTHGSGERLGYSRTASTGKHA